MQSFRRDLEEVLLKTEPRFASRAIRIRLQRTHKIINCVLHLFVLGSSGNRNHCVVSFRCHRIPLGWLDCRYPTCKLASAPVTGKPGFYFSLLFGESSTLVLCPEIVNGPPVLFQMPGVEKRTAAAAVLENFRC